MPLPWDSQHFEIPVGRIAAPELTDSELGGILSFAKEKGYHLVYWATRPERVVPLPLLRRFSGSLVDKKATYQRRLGSDPVFAPLKQPTGTFQVIEYPQAPANRQLLALAVVGGSHSRYQVDPNISREKFESLYHIWINRSTLHEIADVVFVVENSTNMQKYLGVVTCCAKEGMGKIGLIGVQKEAQRQGVGSLLLQTVHQWLKSKEIPLSEVVTQKANVPACKLYEKAGYRLVSLRHYYHFWVQL